jgi:hypothetical protein
MVPNSSTWSAPADTNQTKEPKTKTAKAYQNNQNNQ